MTLPYLLADLVLTLVGEVDLSRPDSSVQVSINTVASCQSNQKEAPAIWYTRPDFTFFGEWNIDPPNLSFNMQLKSGFLMSLVQASVNQTDLI